MIGCLTKVKETTAPNNLQIARPREEMNSCFSKDINVYGNISSLSVTVNVILIVLFDSEWGITNVKEKHLQRCCRLNQMSFTRNWGA